MKRWNMGFEYIHIIHTIIAWPRVYIYIYKQLQYSLPLESSPKKDGFNKGVLQVFRSILAFPPNWKRERVSVQDEFQWGLLPNEPWWEEPSLVSDSNKQLHRWWFVSCPVCWAWSATVSSWAPWLSFKEECWCKTFLPSVWGFLAACELKQH